MPPDDLIGQSQHAAQLADFVLEQLAERLHQFEAQLRRQAAHVVVQLDARGGPRVAMAALDHVGVQGALREELCLGNVLCGVLEDINKSMPDATALFLRIGDARKVREELLARVGDTQVNLEVIAERAFDQFSLAVAQQTGIDENAVQLRANRLMQQRRDDGGVDAARKAAHHVSIADLSPHLGRHGLGEVAHPPIATGLAHLVHEVAQQVHAMGRVRDFGMELHAVELARTSACVGRGADRRGERAGGRACEGGEDTSRV